MSDNSNVYTLAIDWAELEEDKAYLIVINGWQFKSNIAANKYINTLNHGFECLQRQISLIKYYKMKCHSIISPGIK